MSNILKCDRKTGILIETNRLTIGTYKIEDLDLWYKYGQDDYIAKSSGGKTVNSKVVALDSLLGNIKNSILDDSISKRFAIRKKENGLLIGNIGVHSTDKKYIKTIGYWMGANFRNKGYMYEALNSLIEYLKNSYIFRLEIYSDNEASLSLAKKLGFIEVDSYYKDNKKVIKFELQR